MQVKKVFFSFIFRLAASGLFHTVQAVFLNYFGQFRNQVQIMSVTALQQFCQLILENLLAAVNIITEELVYGNIQNISQMNNRRQA